MDSQPPLKEKLTQVKHLLDDANERLQEEASKYGIFTTKTSAVGSATTIITRQNNSGLQDVPSDLKRTMNDISTIQSVLLCPVFNQIVNVTDSLSKLSHHLNLRPSIGPADINFDANGELILKPPIEPTSFNNLMNTRIEDFSENSNHSNNLINSNFINNLNGIGNSEIEQNIFNGQHQMRMHQLTTTNQFDAPNIDRRTNGSAQPLDDQMISRDPMGQLFDNQPHNGPIIKSMIQGNTTSACHGYDTEKLVTNGMQTHINGKEVQNYQQSRVSSVAAAFEANSTPNEGRRLYKANGHQALNQMVPNETEVKRDFEATRSTGQLNEQFDDSQGFGYSNEMYKTTHELDCTDADAIQGQAPVKRPTEDAYMNNLQANNNNPAVVGHNGPKKSQSTQSQRQSRASPSTSASSTVRLADECDSGTSSFRSQAAKGAVHSPQPQKLKEVVTTDEEPFDSSIDQQLIEKLSPEMERIKVTLEKDGDSLGITIAGYTCEQEEISGIFIKSVTPDSPADKSGKIRILDQIFAINGQEILGYSNREAVDALKRHTGKVVTIELMRYLDESKFGKLQSILGHASQSSSLQMMEGQASDNGINSTILDSGRSVKTVVDTNGNNNHSSTSTRPLGSSEKHNISNGEDQPVESPYKNSSVFRKTELLPTNDESRPLNEINSSNSMFQANHQIPVAAQRATSTNKIIETKQGARNKIDIRSPMCQTIATATYVNKVVDMDQCDSAKQGMAARTIHQQSSEDLSFGQIIKSEEPEWEKKVTIVNLYKESSKGLGFTVKEYVNPKDRKQSIIMITSLSPGGVAERDGGLSFGDLLIFVDDTHLEGAGLAEAVNAIKNTSGEVRLGVLKLKRN